MVRFVKLICLVLLLVSFFGGPSVSAVSSGSTAPVTYQNARVIKVIHTQGNADKAEIEFISGPMNGQKSEASTGSLASSLDIPTQNYKAGNIVIVSMGTGVDGNVKYSIVDFLRIPVLAGVFILILVLAIVFAGWRGLGSLLGLIMSVLVLAFFIVPQALKTGNPYPPTIVGVIVISLIGIYVAHGLSRRTSLALMSTYITLFMAIGLSYLVVNLLHLNGIGSESAFYLSAELPKLNIQGLLICGIIISMIGILDDVTVGQVTSVDELHKANPLLTTRELYKRGLKVGREHIASLINTLVLAYVGTSIIFLSYIITISPYPFWIVLNSPVVIQEIARSLIGGITLILAVPVSTYLAARFLRKEPNRDL